MIQIEEYEVPWEVACKMINATKEEETLLGTRRVAPFFTCDELMKIASHIVNYLKVEMEFDECEDSEEE